MLMYRAHKLDMLFFLMCCEFPAEESVPQEKKNMQPQ